MGARSSWAQTYSCAGNPSCVVCPSQLTRSRRSQPVETGQARQAKLQTGKRTGPGGGGRSQFTQQGLGVPLHSPTRIGGGGSQCITQLGCPDEQNRHQSQPHDCRPGGMEKASKMDNRTRADQRTGGGQIAQQARLRVAAAEPAQARDSTELEIDSVTHTTARIRYDKPDTSPRQRGCHQGLIARENLTLLWRRLGQAGVGHPSPHQAMRLVRLSRRMNEW